MIMLLLAACAHAPPPALFPADIPPLTQPPARVQAPSPADACRAAASYLPGRPPPYTLEGLVTCRGQLVPEAQVLELVQDADDAEHWHQVAEACYAYRLTDRQWAEHSMASCRAELDVAEAERNVAEATGAVLFVVGVVVGVGVGLAADAVAP